MNPKPDPCSDGPFAPSYLTGKTKALMERLHEAVVAKEADTDEAIRAYLADAARRNTERIFTTGRVAPREVPLGRAYWREENVPTPPAMHAKLLLRDASRPPTKYPA